MESCRRGRHLVAELLRAEGFEADEAPPGADGGIDITSGRGLLGLESPKLIVQVKTPQIGSERHPGWAAAQLREAA
ncbi:restriction endonuclease [Brachybacterium epidermidis]|uniref:restriction endonuclease n=1 Tax=Brachybacterium epidermidis TaxID=2781983 RepID=UPI00398E3329